MKQRFCIAYFRGDQKLAIFVIVPLNVFTRIARVLRRRLFGMYIGNSIRQRSF